jgi:hypothetical protein
MSIQAMETALRDAEYEEYLRKLEEMVRSLERELESHHHRQKSQHSHSRQESYDPVSSRQTQTH